MDADCDREVNAVFVARENARNAEKLERIVRDTEARQMKYIPGRR